MSRYVGEDEASHQRALFAWANMMRRQYPELRWMHATLNGMAARSPKTAAIQVGLGNRRGVPDVFLDVPRAGYHGLRIELKRPKGGTLSVDQREWIEGYRERGYRAEICRGWEHARQTIVEYLESQ